MAKKSIVKYPTFIGYSKARGIIITKDELAHRLSLSIDFMKLCDDLMEERKHDNSK